jgi:hypothetical protein
VLLVVGVCTLPPHLSRSGSTLGHADSHKGFCRRGGVEGVELGDHHIPYQRDHKQCAWERHSMKGNQTLC